MVLVPEKLHIGGTQVDSDSRTWKGPGTKQ